MNQDNKEFIRLKFKDYFLLENFACKVNYIFYLQKTGQLSREAAYDTIGQLCVQLEQSKKILSLNQSLIWSKEETDWNFYN